MTSNKPIALVTGASAGIGNAVALGLVKAGHEVIGTGRRTAHLARRDGVTYLDLDVTSDESVAAAVAQVIKRHGRIDLLVNNAGVASAGAAEESSVAQVQALFDVNVFGVVRMTNAVLPHMRAQRRGRIVNISSVVGFMPAPFMASYAASKHAIEGYSESLDHEVREHGVRVLLVEPGWTNTGIEANSLRPDTPMDVYAKQRAVADRLIVEAVKAGDDPVAVSQAVIAAATDIKPKLRYTAGSRAGFVSTMRRVVPARAFDRQIRKLNQLAG
ncbi:oxidoreductase [Actinoplanes sp. NEAU-A12]|uniref:Oxidoreductase n=1 Tax=Actinoplanes sandaracinus TaxID=3045177 RepID=A0ABT6WWU6_9ACTN|nr:oxidoreductase [Actinoplanes sandaracinus]MDI6104218.1 oxidoreductase [Actinoplanes sandaracinus]